MLILQKLSEGNTRHLSLHCNSSVNLKLSQKQIFLKDKNFKTENGKLDNLLPFPGFSHRFPIPKLSQSAGFIIKQPSVLSRQHEKNTNASSIKFLKTLISYPLDLVQHRWIHSRKPSKSKLKVHKHGVYLRRRPRAWKGQVAVIQALQILNPSGFLNKQLAHIYLQFPTRYTVCMLYKIVQTTIWVSDYRF